ncbi:MAG TPA: hypothetical protein VFW62_00850 [bacterium]|nr:hypothetical protein [bacterium]
MWPILALAAVVLTGCNLSKDEDSGKSRALPSPPPPPKPPEQDQGYRRICLTDANCPASEREASIYDYIGAVYGEKGRVHFGKPGEAQVLTVGERRYVTEKFGIYKIGDSEAYLSKAQAVFFRDLRFPPDPDCQNEPARASSGFRHVEWGSALVLHGRHGCGQNYADQFLQSGVELSIAANPAPWRFYLESYGSDIAKKVKLEEMELFTRIGETLGVPLANPLPYQASSLEVRKEAATTSKYTVEDFAAAIVFQIAANAAKQNPQVNPRAIFSDVIDRMAPALKMTTEQLFEKTRLFLREFPTMQGQLEESDRRLKHLADTANQVNRGALAKLVAESKDGSRQSLFVLGSNHVDLVKQVYSSEKIK